MLDYIPYILRSIKHLLLILRRVLLSVTICFFATSRNLQIVESILVSHPETCTIVANDLETHTQAQQSFVYPKRIESPVSAFG